MIHDLLDKVVKEQINENIKIDIKVENPQPYLNPNPQIPIPEVKNNE